MKPHITFNQSAPLHSLLSFETQVVSLLWVLVAALLLVWWPATVTSNTNS